MVVDAIVVVDFHSNLQLFWHVESPSFVLHKLHVSPVHVFDLIPKHFSERSRVPKFKVEMVSRLLGNLLKILLFKSRNIEQN